MASNELIETLNAIKLDKDTNLLPENIKSGVTVLGVDGTLESTSGVKLFETTEDMQNDENPQEGDLAVVYREEIQNMTADTQTQYITFPETVTLPEAFTDSVRGMLNAVDASSMFNNQVRLSKTSFNFDGYSENGRIRVQYSSSDGITYTRTRFSGSSGDLTNPVDLGTVVQYEPMMGEWNDALGYFMQIGGMKFDGLYKYTLNEPINSFKLREQSSANYNLTYAQNSPGFDKIYTGEEVFTGEDVGNKIREILKNEIRGAMFLSKDMSILYLVPTQFQNLYVYNNKFEPLVFNSADKATDIVYYKYTLNDMQHKKITMTKSELGIIDDGGVVTNLPDDSYYMLGIVNSTGTYIRWTVSNSSYYQLYTVGTGTEIEYDDRYIIADTQFTLNNANELLPGKIAYGKNGVITGDESIYNNLDISVVLNNIGMPVIYNSAKGLGYDELNKVNTIYSAIEDVTTDRIYYPVISTGIIDTELEDNLQSTLNSTHINTINKTLLPLNNGNYFGVCDATVNNAPSLYGYVINTNGDVQSTYVLNIEDPASRNIFSGLVDVDYYYIFIGDYDVNELGLYKVDRNNGNIVNNTKKSLSYGISAGAAGIAKIDGVMREYYSSFFTIVGNNIVFITQTDTNYEYIGNILVINKDFEDVQTTSYSDISEYSPLPLTLDGYVFWLTQKVGTSTWLLNKYNIAENVVTNIEVGTSTQNWPSIGNIMTDGTYIYVSNDAGTFKISSNLEILETNVDDKNVFLVGDDFINVVEFTDYKNYRAEHMMQSLLIVNGELQESTNSINLWNGTNDEAPILINSRTLNTFMRCYYGGTNIVEYEKFKTVKYEEGIVHPSVGKIIFTGAEDRLTADGWNIIDINEQDYTNTISPAEYTTAVSTTEQILGNE